MVLALVQARVSSSRLPQKVLKLILGAPMLLRQIERIQRSSLIDRLIVVTSTDESDDQIASLCKENNIEVFRGSLQDVLDRFYQAAIRIKPEHIIRLTGDCPLTDPILIDQVISFHLSNNNDYTSNVLQPGFPDGLDVEVFRLSCLEQAWEQADLQSQREHVTPFIYQHPDLFKIGSFTNSIDLSELRWTVDEVLDFKLVSAIYEAIYPANPAFTTDNILEFLNKYPEWKHYNTKYKRNEGYDKSLKEDCILE